MVQIWLNLISGPTHKKGNTLRCSKQTLPGVSEYDVLTRLEVPSAGCGRNSQQGKMKINFRCAKFTEISSLFSKLFYQLTEKVIQRELQWQLFKADIHHSQYTIQSLVSQVTWLKNLRKIVAFFCIKANCFHAKNATIQDSLCMYTSIVYVIVYQ